MIRAFLFVSLSLFLASQVSAKSLKSKKKSVPVADCRLAEGGVVNDESKAILIQQGDKVVAGANRLEEALGLMEVLKKEGACVPAHQECDLAGEGIVAGAWEPHRILLDGQPVDGGRDLGSVMSKLSALRDSGTCTF